MNGIAIVTSAGGGRHKAALESKIRELLRVSRLREEVRIERLADPLDRVVSNTGREIAIRRLDRLTHEIREVQAALVKIANGSYGVCEGCEESIASKRLDAVPWARFCLACQSKGEAMGPGAETALHEAA